MIHQPSSGGKPNQRPQALPVLFDISSAAVNSDPAREYEHRRGLDGRACLAAAVHYRQRFNWSVLSLCPPDHVGVRLVSRDHAKTCRSRGKRPWHTWKEFEDRLPTEDEIRDWWRQLPGSNVGLALGPVSGCVRVDVEGEDAQRQLDDISGKDLPVTVEFRSGRADGSGRGILWAIPPGVVFRTTPVAFVDGELRFQAKGAQTVLPPSRHKDGLLYAWLPGRSPDDVPLALAPSWAVKRWSEGAEARQPRPARKQERTLLDSPTEAEPASVAAVFLALLALDALHQGRAEPYDEWLKIGMALHAVWPGLLPDWDDWSERSCPAKWESGACAAKWRTFDRDKGLSLRHLLTMAYDDGLQRANGDLTSVS